MRKHALVLLGLVTVLSSVGCNKTVTEEVLPLGLEPWAASFEGASYIYGNAIASGPEGDLFLMGDHRANSADSRTFGPVPIDRVVGRAWLRYWPLSAFGILQTPTYPSLAPATP